MTARENNPDADPARAFEALWTRIRRILEWEEGFCIFFIFGDSERAAKELRQRVEDATRLRTGLLQWIRPDAAETARETILQAAFPAPDSECRRYHEQRAPLWVELTAAPNDPAWQAARRATLTALNRVRSALENRCPRPFFLQLPASMAPEAPDYAPDLWSIRQLVAVLPAITTLPASAFALHARKAVPRPLGARQLQRQWRGGLNDTQKNARRLIAALQNAVLPHPDAARLETAIAAYRDALPRLFALQKSLAASERARRGTARGSPDAAAAWRETLAYYEAFDQAVGDAPTILREALACLRKLGNAAQRAGQYETAQTAFRHAAQLASPLLPWRDSLQRLLENDHFPPAARQDFFDRRIKLGDTPQTLRDLSQVRDKVLALETRLDQLPAPGTDAEE